MSMKRLTMSPAKAENPHAKNKTQTTLNFTKCTKLISLLSYSRLTDSYFISMTLFSLLKLCSVNEELRYGRVVMAFACNVSPSGWPTAGSKTEPGTF
jgi:hypothetical protein